MIKIFSIYLSLLCAATPLTSCSSSSDTDDTTETVEQGQDSDISWRYFDREVYLPQGSSLAPEIGVALQVITAALKELEEKTDLGKGYFKISSVENTLLQPIVTATSYQGRNWRSFFQVFNDDQINSLLNENLTEDSDADVIVAKNAANEQQFYVVTRLSCFIGAASCGLAPQTYAKELVWRAIGYLIGMDTTETRSSTIMSQGYQASEISEADERRFTAEFNNRLEDIKTGR